MASQQGINTIFGFRSIKKIINKLRCKSVSFESEIGIKTSGGTTARLVREKREGD
jgi:hypothetical protein